MRKLKYELVGKDLPETYREQQDPLLHYEESFLLARGEGWVAEIVSRGEIRAYQNGERIKGYEIVDYYDTDEALNKAIDSGELKIDNNNWYEIEVLAEDDENEYEYLDIMSDDCVCFSFDEALHIFNDYVNDERWVEDLIKYVKEAKTK